MGLKKNFYQALRELLGGGGQTEPDAAQKADSGLESESEIQRASSAEDLYEYAGSEYKDSETKLDGEKGSAASSKPVFSPGLFGKPGQPARATAADQINPSSWAEYFGGAEPAVQPVLNRTEEEMTVISKSTVVVGDIRSLANITIEGKVRGDVDVLKDATLHGVLVGDLMCSNSKMEGSSVQGNVNAKGSAYIFNDSMLLGDLKAQSSNIDGKVKGNMDIGGKVQLYRNAVVAGDINTNTITIEEGANIKGFVNTSFLSEHGDNIFPGEVAIDNESNR